MGRVHHEIEALHREGADRVKVILLLITSSIVFPMTVFYSFFPFLGDEYGMTIYSSENFEFGIESIQSDSFLYYLHWKILSLKIGPVFGVYKENAVFGIDGECFIGEDIIVGLKFTFLPLYEYFIAPAMGLKF